MSERPDAVRVGPNANVTPDEYKAFKYLTEQGATVYFQLVPDSKLTSFEDVSKNFE